MNKDDQNCPLCGRPATLGTVDGHHNWVRYSGCECGEYYIVGQHIEMYVKGPNGKYHKSRAEISMLLRERAVRGTEPPLVQFGSESIQKIPLPVLHADELLGTWPRTIPERIDRGFCNVVYAKPDSGPGHDLTVDRHDPHLVFAHDSAGLDYYLDAMVDYKWVKKARQDEKFPKHTRIGITPQGWAHFDELERGRSNVKNPVFVAMWFGGKDRRNEMTTLYKDAIAPAVKETRYRVKRADTDEHNEPIMDRIIADIRRAPFVVAELTDNNKGVYYEAGFARGCGIEVIYCCPEGQKVHFDLSGVNHVKWKDKTDLLKRLEDRILGTLGKGPYSFDEDNAFTPYGCLIGSPTSRGGGPPAVRISPGGAYEISPGRQPGVLKRSNGASPVGAAESGMCRPAGAQCRSTLLSPRLTPWASFFRPFGTEEVYTGSLGATSVGARDR